MIWWILGILLGGFLLWLIVMWTCIGGLFLFFRLFEMLPEKWKQPPKKKADAFTEEHRPESFVR